MNTEISRRDFIRVAFGTVSAAVLSNPAQLNLLPAGVSDRPTSRAYPLAISENGYIYDPTFSNKRPTYRDMLWDELERLSKDEQERHFAQWRIERGYCEDEGWDVWSGPDLDDEIEPENFSPYELAKITESHTGMDLYEALDQEAIQRLELVLVEGDSPGGHFTAVKTNNPSGLHEGLLREGINVEVSMEA